MDAQSQRKSTLVTMVRVIARDGHCAVDGHLMLLTVLRYMERVWRELRRKREVKVFGEFG